MGYKTTYGNEQKAQAEAIADEFVARGIGLNSSSIDSGGGGDASAQNQQTEIARLEEIRDSVRDGTSSNTSSVGSPSDYPAYAVSDGYGNIPPWSLISVVKGILQSLQYIAYNSISVRILPPISNYSFQDFSGVLQTANTPFQPNNLQYYNLKKIIIQNLGTLNSSTNIYEGELYINIGSDGNSGSSRIGYFRLFPGDTLELDGSIMPNPANIWLMGSVSGIEFTFRGA